MKINKFWFEAIFAIVVGFLMTLFMTFFIIIFTAGFTDSFFLCMDGIFLNWFCNFNSNFACCNSFN